jgi:hypothetical protein
MMTQRESGKLPMLMEMEMELVKKGGKRHLYVYNPPTPKVIR